MTIVPQARNKKGKYYQQCTWYISSFFTSHIIQLSLLLHVISCKEITLNEQASPQRH